jgi:RimJ/RimL family protein N-acetyltransferase
MQAMLDPSSYLAPERLRDGRRFEIRAFRPDDRAGMLEAVQRTSARSLYRRFFTVKRRFSEREVEFFVNVDFLKHVALVAVVPEDGRQTIVGGGRYVVVQPGKAEVAFAIVDQYQGQGVGTLLMHHLARIARDAGIKDLVAEVLPENIPMLKVFEKCGYRMDTDREDEVIHVALHLE